MKPLVAKKYKHQQPYIGWRPFHDRRVVCYGIEWLGDVETKDGPMSRVKMNRRMELANPATDVAILLGKVAVKLPDGPDGVSKFDELAPDLFNWAHPTLGDQYWIKANDGFGVEWCKARTYLLYRVDVDVPDGFIENLNAEHDRIEAEKSQV